MATVTALFGLGVGSIVQAVFSQLTHWVGEGAAGVVSAVGHSLDASTRPALGAGFSAEYSTMTVIAAVLSAPFLVLTLIQAVARQDLAMVGRAALVRLPASILLGAGAVELVRMSLAATDELSLGLLHSAGAPARSLFAALTAALLGIGAAGGALPFAGFAALLFAGFAAMLAFVLWLELAVRAAAVAAATLFLPLALAGLVWSATAHWARRLAETIAALVLSKLAIAAVLALAASTLGSAGAGSGGSGVVEGVALLMMAAVAPFSLLRLLPMIESGAIGHLEGHARRPVHLADPSSPARRLQSGAIDLVQARLGGGGSGDSEMTGTESPRSAGDFEVDPRYIYPPSPNEAEEVLRETARLAPHGAVAGRGPAPEQSGPVPQGPWPPGQDE